MQNFERARTTMVDTQIRPSSITDSKLIAALGNIPREHFVPEERRSIAYVDVNHPLSPNGRFLSAPAAFAKLVQLADIGESDVVLDIGCGTGYSTAVIASLASAVVGLEDDPELVEKANAIFSDLDIGNAAVLEGKLDEGVPSEAPFDVIVMEGAVDMVSPALLAQLRNGGRLVAMLAKGATSTAQVFVKTDAGIAVRSSFNANLPKLTHAQHQSAFSL